MQTFAIPILIAFNIIVLGLTLVWRSKQSQANRQIIFSGVGAILTAVILVVMQRGEMTLPTATSGTAFKTVGSILLVLSLNAFIQFLRHALVVGVLEKRNIDIPSFVLDLLTWLLVIGLSVPLLSASFGLTLTGVLVTSTVVSAVIGLALQDTLGNLISGIALQIEYPFRNNDWVEINGHEGQVVSQNWRTLSLRTRDDNYILVTNANVAKSDIINYSRPSRISAQNAYIGVAYHVPPGEAKQVLVESVLAVEGVETTPAPRVELIEFGDSSVNYRVRYWINDFARKPTISDEVMTRIWYTLDRAGMTIPFPQRDVHLYENSAELIASKQAQATSDRFNVLRSLPLFDKLTDDQLMTIAEEATLKRFAIGERLIAQGQTTEALYILRNGAVEMLVSAENGRQQPLEGMYHDGYFGIISLLTNETSAFSLATTQPSNVVTINKAAFANAMAYDPNMLNQLIDTVAQRQRQIEAGLAKTQATSDQATIAGHAALLNRVRAFLGIYGK